MDSVKFLLYVLGRIGVLIAGKSFWSVYRKVLFPALASLVSRLLKCGREDFTNSTWGFVCGAGR